MRQAKDYDADIRRLRAQGKAVTEIGKILNFSPASISKRLQVMNLTRFPGSRICDENRKRCPQCNKQLVKIGTRQKLDGSIYQKYRPCSCRKK